MRTIRTEMFRAEIRRIRRGVSQLFREEAGQVGGRPAPLVPPSLTIRDVMQTELATVRPESLLGPAVRMMIDQDVSSLPVVDAEGFIVGALNQKDVLRAFYELDATVVASVMTMDPIVMPIEAPLVDVIDQLMSTEFRRVLIHEAGKFAGVIVRSDLMHAVLLTIEEVQSTRAQAQGRVSDPG